MRSVCFTLAALAFLMVGDSRLNGQYPPGGGYPPGSYPPGRYPGGGGLPFPRRGKSKTTKEKEQQQQLQDVRGMLRKLDDESIIVEAADTRIIELKRAVTTKFLKDGAEMKQELLKPGDH